MSKTKYQGAIPAVKEQKRLDRSSLYIDTNGQLHIPKLLEKPLKLGSRHPYFYILHNGDIIDRALDRCTNYLSVQFGKPFHFLKDKIQGE